MLRLTHLNISNALSFGTNGDRVGIGPLNVLIGANASGKSNVVDVLSLLQALPTDLTEPIRDGGGVQEWIWKGPGAKVDGAMIPAQIEARFSRADGPDLRHWFVFAPRGARTMIIDERIEDCEAKKGKEKPYLYFGFENGVPMFNVRGGGTRRLAREELREDQSVLAQRNDPHAYPELTALRDFYAGFRIYRDWTAGRRSELRTPQPADLPDDFLMPSGRNLAIMLNALQRFPEEWDGLNAAMSRFHPGFKEVKTLVQGNTVQLFLRENGLGGLTPATRLSDGTLRYLALLTILLHPEPPRLVCIEEPELGLHPDLVDDLARLLVAASDRTQIVVTTHSDHLVNALSAEPSSILVAERGTEGTTLRRLDPEKLKSWLDTYRLGELWMSGHIGGTRW